MVVISSIFTTILLLLILYLLTDGTTFIVFELFLTTALFVWRVLKLSEFTNRLCQTLDAMIDGSERPQIDFETETSFARISHRLERLYNMMQINRRKIEKEKIELQSLVSDISHQTKTPIANLKMINDTLLNREMPKEKQQEFLQAVGSQLDKLDFLIHAIVKTSRLETGVIILEKKEALFIDTLTAAFNAILVPMEKNRLPCQ